MSNLFSETQQDLTKQILQLPPQLLEQIIKKCRLELEEKIYEEMYQNLNGYLPEDVADMVSDKRQGRYEDYSYIKRARPYVYELADRISDKIIEQDQERE